MAIRIRYSDFSFLLVAVIALVLCSFIAWINNLHLAQVHRVNSVLAEYPQIDKVWASTNDDVELEVEELYFSVDGQPGVVFGIIGTDGANKATLRTLLDQALKQQRPVQLPPYATEFRR